jgi:hypothetical protein
MRYPQISLKNTDPMPSFSRGNDYPFIIFFQTIHPVVPTQAKKPKATNNSNFLGEEARSGTVDDSRTV